MSTSIALGDRVSVFGRGHNRNGVVTMVLRGVGLLGGEQYHVRFDGHDGHTGPIYAGEIAKETNS